MTFKEYYETCYKPNHHDTLCIAFHWAGLAAALGIILGICISSVSWWWLLAVPAPVYGFGFVGHLLTGTRPQCLRHPLWSIAAYFYMLYESIFLSADFWGATHE